MLYMKLFRKGETREGGEIGEERELRLNDVGVCSVVCCRGVQLSGGPSLSGLVSVSRGAIGSC